MLPLRVYAPSDRSGFKATRVFRGVTCHISVEHVGTGDAVSLTMDGRPVEGNVVPLPPADQAEVVVEVILT